MEMNINITVF